jgi:hypothetical protein
MINQKESFLRVDKSALLHVRGAAIAGRSWEAWRTAHVVNSTLEHDRGLTEARETDKGAGKFKG